jgi:polar amino acid transport system substrate-binding protein
MQQAIDDGSDIRIIGEPLFVEELAVAFDKDAELDNASLVQRVSEIVEEMHADGTLTELSVKWYGVDLTTPS